MATTNRKPLAAIVGAACATALCALVPFYEGVRYDPYQDVNGIWTVCAGNTHGVEQRRYSDAECAQQLQDQLTSHATDVLACTPSLKDKAGPLVAAVDFAYNVGAAKYCSSTMARKFNAGDIMGACAELSKWIRASGQVLPGLVKRRKAEREICEHGLTQ